MYYPGYELPVLDLINIRVSKSVAYVYLINILVTFALEHSFNNSAGQNKIEVGQVSFAETCHYPATTTGHLRIAAVTNVCSKG
jgi:hypothetical protein